MRFIARVMTMSSGFNVFGPEDLERAESVLNEVWTLLPGDVRNGPGAVVLRERLARHVLAAMTNSRADHDELKASVMRTGTADWSHT
jgi:hypothetical protein